MAEENKAYDNVIEENLNAGVTASGAVDIDAPSAPKDKKSLLDRITVTAPLGSCL